MSEETNSNTHKKSKEQLAGPSSTQQNGETNKRNRPTRQFYNSNRARSRNKKLDPNDGPIPLIPMDVVTPGSIIPAQDESRPRSRPKRKSKPKTDSPPVKEDKNVEQLPQASSSLEKQKMQKSDVNQSWRNRSNANQPNASNSLATGHSIQTPLPQHHVPRPAGLRTYASIFYSLLNNTSLQKLRRDSMCQEFEKMFQEFQLEEMMKALSLTGEGMHMRHKILDDLLFILQKEYPHVCIYAFGSFLTGVGDSSSDIDLYIDAFGTSEGKLRPRQYSSTQDVLETCFRCLRRAKCPTHFRAFCKQVIPIREARVPILKTTHYSNVNIDLSFENLTSLKNSQMILLYMNLNPYVKPLCVLIRFWARFHCLTGSNNIKNYCLILMILVFLSQQKIVPPVIALRKIREIERQRKTKPENNNPDMIEGWDTGFTTDIKAIRVNYPEYFGQDTNGSFFGTVLRLAKDFFDMYASIDFASNMICSYTAEIIPRNLFTAGNEEDLPETLDMYKEWAVKQPRNRRLNTKTHLCVQDPFILGFNVGGPTPFGNLLKFQIACKETSSILQAGITSLLELFVPLPREVGDRKFLNMQERQRRTMELKQEIEEFIKTGELEETVVDEEKEENLGLHKLSLQELINKNSVRFGKGWESLLDFVPSVDFQSAFAQGIFAHKLHLTLSKSFLLKKLKLFWLSVINDFIETFWNDCLKLEVSREERVKLEKMYVDPPFALKTRKNYESIFETKKVSKFISNRTELKNQGSSQEQKDALFERLEELGEIEEKMVFIKLVCTSTCQVWHQRMRVFDEVVRKLGNVEAKGEKDEKNSPPMRSIKKSFKRSILENRDPFEIQKEVTRLMLERKEDEDEQLAFTAFIKIDYTLIDEMPVAYFIFEKTPETRITTYNQGMPAFVDTIHEIMEPYCMYRLKNLFALEEDNSQDVSEDYYDLIMPPSESSSSECSSPAPN